MKQTVVQNPRNKSDIKAQQNKKSRRKTLKLRIPREKLESSLKLILDESNKVWCDNNNSCLPHIHGNSGHIENRLAALLKLGRSYLLKRDWKHVAKTVATSNASRSRNDTLHRPAFLKYAIAYLAYNNLDRLWAMLHSLSLSNEEYCNIHKYTSLKCIAQLQNAS